MALCCSSCARLCAKDKVARWPPSKGVGNASSWQILSGAGFVKGRNNNSSKQAARIGTPAASAASSRSEAATINYSVAQSFWELLMAINSFMGSERNKSNQIQLGDQEGLVVFVRTKHPGSKKLQWLTRRWGHFFLAGTKNLSFFLIINH